MRRANTLALSLALGTFLALGLSPALSAGLSTGAALSPGDPAPEDSRWLAWLGCWEPAGDSSEDGAEILVCIEAISDGVQISTLADGELMGTERILADGRPQPAAEGGCEGTREARWSADDRRVFVLSELTCAEGVHRTTSGVFAITGDGERWTEIHAVRSGEREPVLAVRSFQPASSGTLARHEHADPQEHRGLAVRTSRLAAAAPLEVGDVVEAVEIGGEELASALVIEMGHPFELDAATLRGAARAGVPEPVLDMMVAMTWPERFQVEAGEADLEQQQVADRRYGPTRSWSGPIYPTCRGFDPFCHRARFGLAYGYGFGGGFYPGSFYSPIHFGSPRYIVITPPNVRDRSGRVSPDGYSSGNRETRGTARPRSGRAGPPSTQAQPRPTRNDRPAASGGSTRSGSSDDRRPARPRGGGGGGG